MVRSLQEMLSLHCMPQKFIAEAMVLVHVHVRTVYCTYVRTSVRNCKYLFCEFWVANEFLVTKGLLLHVRTEQIQNY